MSDENAVVVETTESTNEPSAESVELAQRPGETKAETARRIKIQWEGQEQELDDKSLVDTLLAALGEDGLKNVAQLGKVARTKVSKLGQQEQALREAAADLKDPKRMFALVERIHGKKAARTFVEDYYAGVLEEDRLPQEEREKRSLKSEVEQLRAERERLASEKQQREMATQVQAQQRAIGKAFTAALGEVGIDPTPHTLARMAALAEADLAETGSFDPRDVARAVAQEYEQGEVAGFLKNLAKNPEKLAKYLGQDGLRALRQWDVDRVKGAPSKVAQPSAAPSRRTEQPAREKVKVDDFFAKLGKR
jgi:hypothetical protein